MLLYSVVSPVLIKLYYHCVAPCNKLYHNTTDTKKSTCDCASNKYSLYPRLSDSSYAAEHKSVGTMERKDSTVLCKCSRPSG